jgi:hypothetical protein
MAEYNSWRNFWWLNVALNAVIFLVALVGFPETKWHRPHPSEMTAKDPELSDASPGENATSGNAKSLDAGEKGGVPSSAVDMPDLGHVAAAERDPWLGRGRPSKRQFLPFQPNAHPFRSIANEIWIPWKLFAFPIVEFASFVVSWAASVFLLLNLTQSQVFAAEPYNFSDTAVGMTNWATFVGALIGLGTAGPLSDWISMRATIKNNGIREPEMRLPTMIPYVVIMLLGNFVTAFGYQYGWNQWVSFEILASPLDDCPLS